MRFLGIDYGEKRVGVALSDDKGILAFPHSVIPNTAGLITEIAEILRLSNVGVVVIGESRNYKGEKNRIMDEIMPFSRQIQGLGYKVVFEPEVLTSHQAAYFQGKTDKIDAAAASIILQSYIDRLKNEEGTHIY